MHALFIPADENRMAQLVDVDVDSAFGLQRLVGGYIEGRGLLNRDGTVVGFAYLHEEGKAAGKPANPRVHQLLETLKVEFDTTDFIVGDVVLLGPPAILEGRDTPVTPEALNAYRFACGPVDDLLI